MSRKIALVPVVLIASASLVLAACAPAAPSTQAAGTSTAEATKPAGPTATPTRVPPTPTPPPPPVCEPIAGAPAAPAAGTLGSADNPIVITFTPSADPGRIANGGAAMADCLNKMTGLTFKVEIGDSASASIESMGTGKAQVSFLSTLSALLANSKYGVVPLLLAVRKYNSTTGDPDAALKGTPEPFYRSEFIAGAGTGIKSLAGLKGKTMCFFDPLSIPGYVMPYVVLKANGIDPEKDFKKVIMAGSYNNVAIAVYKGDCDAGAAYIDVLTDTSANLAAKYPDIATKVAPFAVTDRIPNDGIQVIKDLDPALKSLVAGGLLAMSKDPGGKAIIKSLYNYDSLAEVDPTTYASLIALFAKAGVDPALLLR